MLALIDISPKEYSFSQNLWCLILYSIIVLIFYDSNICSFRRWNNKKYDHTRLLFFLFFLYALTGFVDHDYWGYYEVVKLQPIDDTAHVESPYRFIIRIFNRNYLIFRTFVWGSAIWIFSLGAKAAKINIYHSLYLLAVCFIGTFTYGRVSLAMALVFTGYIIFCQNYKSNVRRAIFGGIIFVCAFFFHNSIVFAMFVSILMTYIPINKRTIWICLFSFPLLIVAVKIGLSYILETGLGLSTETADAALRYSGYVRESTNAAGKIRAMFEYARFYIPAYIGIKMLFMTGKYKHTELLTVNLFKIAIGLIFLGTCLFFVGFDNNIFAYRIMFMSMIPLIYSIIKFYKYQIITPKQLKLIIWCGIIGTGYGLLYGAYKLI